MLLVYLPGSPSEGRGRINHNTTTKGVIKCLLPVARWLASVVNCNDVKRTINELLLVWPHSYAGPTHGWATVELKLARLAFNERWLALAGMIQGKETIRKDCRDGIARKYCNARLLRQVVRRSLSD